MVETYGAGALWYSATETRTARGMCSWCSQGCAFCPLERDAAIWFAPHWPGPSLAGSRWINHTPFRGPVVARSLWVPPLHSWSSLLECPSAEPHWLVLVEPSRKLRFGLYTRTCTFSNISVAYLAWVVLVLLEMQVLQSCSV